MKLTLVVTDTRRKSVVFVSDTLQVMSFEEAANVSLKGDLEHVYTVRGKFGMYLRSLPNTSEKDNIDTLSVAVADILAYVNRTRHFQSTDAISMYVAQYSASILEQGNSFVETVDGDKAFVTSVRDAIKSYAKIILQAAAKFDLDPYLLGAILIDEFVRLAPFEDIQDRFWLGLLGRNVSVGIAQVKLETANDLIKRGLYNPNPDDAKLPFAGNLRKKDREHLYEYVVQPKHNIRFAAAYIRSIITVWASYIDLSLRPEIIGTLYSQGYGAPKSNPSSIPQGDQIATEFYELAKKWFK